MPRGPRNSSGKSVAQLGLSPSGDCLHGVASGEHTAPAQLPDLVNKHMAATQVRVCSWSSAKLVRQPSLQRIAEEQAYDHKETIIQASLHAHHCHT